MNRVADLGCARALAAMQRRLDGDALDDATAARLEEHLSRCSHCQRVSTELDALSRALRALPEIPLPEHALASVWKRTLGNRRSSGWFDWRAAAAAAVLTAALGGLWYAGRSSPARVGVAEAAPTEAELAQAAAEARFVLGLTAAVLDKSERVAIGEVLGQRVAPALSKVPIVWPAPAAPRGRRGGRDA